MGLFDQIKELLTAPGSTVGALDAFKKKHGLSDSQVAKLLAQFSQHQTPSPKNVLGGAFGIKNRGSVTTCLNCGAQTTNPYGAQVMQGCALCGYGAQQALPNQVYAQAYAQQAYAQMNLNQQRKMQAAQQNALNQVLGGLGSSPPNAPLRTARQDRLMRAWVQSGFDEAIYLDILKNGTLEEWWEEPKEEEMSVRACRVWYDEASNSYAVSSPFDQNLVAWWKSEIPKEHRAWNADQKLWLISPQMKDKVCAKLKAVFGDVHITEKVEGAVVSTILNENEFTTFCQLVGKDLLKEAYRKASLSLHPDKAGGDANKMADLNRAWNEVQKGVK